MAAMGNPGYQDMGNACLLMSAGVAYLDQPRCSRWATRSQL